MSWHALVQVGVLSRSSARSSSVRFFLSYPRTHMPEQRCGVRRAPAANDLHSGAVSSLQESYTGSFRSHPLVAHDYTIVASDL